MFAKFVIFAIIAIFVKFATFQWAPLDSFEFPQTFGEFCHFCCCVHFWGYLAKGQALIPGRAQAFIAIK